MKIGERGGLLRRNHEFRLLWYSETAGNFGSSVTAVAAPLAAVSVLHASAFDVSLLTAAAWLPWLIVGLPAGVWIDRMARRPILLASNAVKLVLYLAIPSAYWLGLFTIGQLLLLTLFAGAANVFFRTAYSAYLPALVANEDKAEANAKLHGSESAAQIAGLGSSGLITQLAGATNGLLAEASTFLVSHICLSRIRYREPAPETVDRPRGALRREVGEGLSLVLQDPYMRPLTLYGAAFNLIMTGFQSLQIVFLVRDIGLSAGMIGALATVGGLGGIAGALMVRRITSRVGTARALLVFELITPPAVAMILLANKGPGLLLIVVGAAGASLGLVASNIINATFFQQYCASDVLGRVNATSSFLLYGTMPVGAVLGGALASGLGIRTAMWTLTVGLALTELILTPPRSCTSAISRIPPRRMSATTRSPRTRRRAHSACSKCDLGRDANKANQHHHARHDRALPGARARGVVSPGVRRVSGFVPGDGRL